MNKAISLLPRRAAGAFILALAMVTPVTFAASTDTWVGGTGNNFSTTANWTYSSGSGPVATGDSLVFGTVGSTTPNNDEASFTFGGINFNWGASQVYTVGGNAFTLSGTITDNYTNAGAIETINNNITLASGGGIVSVGTNSSLTLGGIISGSGNFTKTGGSSGILTLSGVNTFSGALSMNAGTVVFTTPPNASGGNLGNPSGISFGGGSTTTLVTTPGAGSINISFPTITNAASSTGLYKNGGASGTTFEISAKITGPGNCKQNSPTTSGAIVRFSNDASDYTGTFSTAAGTIEFSSVANGGSPSSLGAGSTAITNANSTSASTFRYVGAGNTATTRALNCTATTGAFTLDSSGAGSVQFLASANWRSGVGGIESLTLRGSSVGANTMAQVINDQGGATSVTKSDAGLWILSGANTYSGTTFIFGGTLQLSGSGTLGSTTGTLSMNGGILDLGGTSQTQGVVNIQAASTIQNGTLTNATSFFAPFPSGMSTVSASLAGAVGLNFLGAGTLGLYGVNSYSLGTTISEAGILVITNDAGLGNASGGLLFSAGGTLAATNNAAAVNSPVTLGSSRTITVNNTITASFATPDTNNLTIAAKITGAGAVLKKSSSFSLGTLRFSNDASDYTGDFSVGFGNTEFTSVAEQGTASSLGAGASGTGGQITLGSASSAGTLRYVGSGNSSTHRPLNWTGTTATGGYTLDASGSGTIQFLGTGILRSGSGGIIPLFLRGSNTGSNVLAHVINDLSGATSLVKNDAGTWVLAATNTFSGGVNLIGGVVQVNAAETPGTSGPLGKTGTITNSGGTLQYSAADNADYSSRFSTTTGQTFKIDCNGRSVTYATALVGAGNSLTVSSSSAGGALTLTASNTFTGNTVIRSGTLVLSGSGAVALSPVISVGAGATFDVSGIGGGYTLGAQTLYATNGATATNNGSLSLGTASLVLTNVPNTPTITVTGGALTLASGNATTVNLNNSGTRLVAGSYKLISKGAGGSVAGTAPSSVTVGGDGIAIGAVAHLQILAGELFLNVCVAPTATIRSADSVTNCPGVSVTIHADLTGVGPWNVTWSDGTVQTGVSASPATLTVAPTATTTNTVTSVTDSCFGGGTASGSAVVTMSSESAPVFSGNLIAVTVSNLPITIATVKFMALASDPEHDALTLSGFSAASAQGGTIVQNGSTNATYTPPPTYVGADSFTYWVSDGCKQATNTVNVTVLSGNGFSPNVVFGPAIDGTDFVVRFAGIPGYTYTIEYSPGLTGPWAKTTNATAPTDNSQGFGPGIFEFRESTLGATERYYRTVYPSY